MRAKKSSSRVLNRLALALTIMPLVLASTACEAVKDALASASKPEATITGASLKDLGLEGAVLVFDVAISNPYDLPLPLAKLDYALVSGGKRLLEGVSPERGTIPANGRRTIPVSARLVFADVLQALSGVRPGAVVPYEATFGITVEPPALQPLRLPLTKTGELPIPAVPSIALEEIRWQSLTLERAEAVMALKVGNTNSFPLDLRALSYALSLAGTPVASAGVQQPPKLNPGTAETLQIPLSLRPIDLGLAAFNMLRSPSASYSLTGGLEAMTPFGPLSLPLTASGTAPLRQ